jgi:hypothetical protein
MAFEIFSRFCAKELTFITYKTTQMKADLIAALSDHLGNARLPRMTN